MEGTSKLLDGKVCLITGGTSGIGKETALGLARAGGTVVIVGRNSSKGADIVQEIKDQSGNPRIDMLLADLSSLSEVRRLVTQFHEKYTALHVLVNNAGGFFLGHQETGDGLEMTFALNYFSPFLLTNLLLDSLKANVPARIVNVSSGSHKSTHHFDPDNIHKFSGFGAYGASKLALVYFTYELARRLEGTGVSVNALHPGVVRTNIGRNNTGGFLFSVFARIAGVTPQVGAQTSIYLATSSEVTGVTGKYFEKCKAVPSSKLSYDQENARRLWEISEKITKLSPNS